MLSISDEIKKRTEVAEMSSAAERGWTHAENLIKDVYYLLEDNECLRDKIDDQALGYGEKWKALALEAREQRNQLQEKVVQLEGESQSWRRSLTGEACKDAEHSLESLLLQRELEEQRKITKNYRKALSDIHNVLRWYGADNTLDKVDSIIETALGQEGKGEGDQ